MINYRPEKIHRIVLKISGEFLAGTNGFGFDNDTVLKLVDDIIEIKRLGISIGIVVGGGNIFRGVSIAEDGINRVVADDVGMLATVQNSLVIADYLKRRNYDTEIYSAIQIDKITKYYAANRAITSLKEGKICFICAGTGNPYFTTDTAGVLRALELGANLMLKGTKVDGVYSADPKKDKDAVYYDSISYDEVLANKLNVMDMTAFSLARDFGMPIKVFNILKKGNLKDAILNKATGTFIHP